MSLLSLLNGFQGPRTSHVLLYHSTYSEVPQDLKEGLHNVTPDVLEAQLTWLKRHFRFVTIDELFEDPGPGKAAVTFDDGYDSVFSEAIPVLVRLGIPCTVFLNGCSFQGKPFWRDKIRYVLSHNLAEEFLQAYERNAGTTNGMTVETMYWKSKGVGINSADMDRRLDAFLGEKGIDLSRSLHCVSSLERLTRHPLVTYGNHTMNHYVLSSLPHERQEEEIAGGQRFLEALGVPLSRIFSIPFGGTGDFTPETVEIVKATGYRGMLLSRNRLNRLRNGTIPPMAGLPCLERYMVPPSFGEHQRHMLGMWSRMPRLNGGQTA